MSETVPLPSAEKATFPLIRSIPDTAFARFGESAAAAVLLLSDNVDVEPPQGRVGILKDASNLKRGVVEDRQKSSTIYNVLAIPIGI